MTASKKPTVVSLLNIRRPESGRAMFDITTGCLRISQKKALRLLKKIDGVTGVVALSDEVVRVAWEGWPDIRSVRRQVSKEFELYVRLPDDLDYTHTD